ncbi:MAG: M13 family metallopeptidase [Terriglobales bacterium]
MKRSLTLRTHFSAIALCAAMTLGVSLARPALAAGQAQPAQHGIAVSHMDRSVVPGNNFYEYCNGTWLKQTTIPPDRASYGVFTALDDQATKNTAALIEQMAKSNPAAGTEQRKIADLYASYMNEAAIEKNGMAELRPHIDAINAIKDKRDLAKALGASLRADVDPLNNTNFHTANLFGLWTAPGFEDADHYTPYLLQGGLTLPDREYYLSTSEHMKQIQEAYLKHAAAMFKLAGFDDPDARAKRVYDLEHAIAETHRPLAENEDIHKANNPWSRADFTSKAPGLDWNEYFTAANLARQQKFIVWQPEAFTGEAALVQSQPIEAWKDWLAFHLIENYAGAVSKPLADERFAFFGKTLSGAEQQRPRDKRAVAIVNDLLGDAVGKEYAKRYFSPQAKAEAQKMVQNLIAAFRKRIEALTWMNPSTKKEAEAKLGTLYVGVGYPETWKDYSAYQVKPDDLFGNEWRADIYEYNRQLHRIGGTVDKHEWSMTPQTVNAVNLPLQNALNFPAAILQPPFFDAKAPAAANYGAIGTVMGHEISHTFDTEGATFDASGRLRNWWTPEDLKHFEQVTTALANQYDKYEPFPGVHVNGRQTLGEDIADVAGIAASFDGYHASLNGKNPPEQDGFTGDQQFFIAFGQNWARKARPAAVRQQVLTDPHAPAEYRADTVRNIDAWYKSFNVKPGESLYLPEGERVKIW